MQAIHEKAKHNRSACRVEISKFGVSYMAGGITLFVASSTDNVRFYYDSPWESGVFEASAQDVLSVVSRMNNLSQSEIDSYVAVSQCEY